MKPTLKPAHLDCDKDHEYCDDDKIKQKDSDEQKKRKRNEQEEENEKDKKYKDQYKNDPYGFSDYWGAPPVVAKKKDVSFVPDARDLCAMAAELRAETSNPSEEVKLLQTSEKMEASALLGLEEKLLSDFCLQNELTSEFLTQFDPLSKPKL